GMNRRIKPLDDKRVRRALIHAIDRTAVIDEVFLGRYLPARGVLPPGTQGYNPKLQSYTYDPQKARELLAEAGYPGGRGLPPIAFWHYTDERVFQPYVRSVEVNGLGDPYIPLRKIWLDRRSEPRLPVAARQAAVGHDFRHCAGDGDADRRGGPPPSRRHRGRGGAPRRGARAQPGGALPH